MNVRSGSDVSPPLVGFCVGGITYGFGTSSVVLPCHESVSYGDVCDRSQIVTNDTDGIEPQSLLSQWLALSVRSDQIFWVVRWFVVGGDSYDG